jgi:hypothetical protein
MSMPITAKSPVSSNTMSGQPRQANKRLGFSLVLKLDSAQMYLSERGLAAATVREFGLNGDHTPASPR